MKKTILLMAAIAILASFGFVPSVNGADANRMFYVTLLPPSDSTNATTTGSIFDLSAYKGNGTFIASVGAATASNQITTVTITHSTNAAFSTSATVTNINDVAGVMANTAGLTTTNGVLTSQFACDTGRLHRYVRAVVTQSLADQSAPVSVMFVAPFKSE